jgi:hypothetical protein
VRTSHRALAASIEGSARVLAKNGTGIIAGPLHALKCLMMMGAMIGMLALTGCGPEARWTRADLFSQTEAARSQQVVDASRVSVAFLGGVQRGLNLKLDEAVKTDQGLTQYIYLEQPVQLPTGITLMKRFRVHFDLAGSPLYIEEIVRSPVK